MKECVLPHFAIEIGAVFSINLHVSVGLMDVLPLFKNKNKKIHQSKSVRVAFAAGMMYILGYSVDFTNNHHNVGVTAFHKAFQLVAQENLIWKAEECRIQWQKGTDE